VNRHLARRSLVARRLLRRQAGKNTRLALRLATAEGADSATLAALVFVSPEFQQK